MKQAKQGIPQKNDMEEFALKQKSITRVRSV